MSTPDNIPPQAPPGAGTETPPYYIHPAGEQPITKGTRLAFTMWVVLFFTILITALLLYIFDHIKYRM
jgi:hypothetical protein